MKVEDTRSEYDRGYHAGLLTAYLEIESWSQGRLDQLDPGKNQKMRDEIDTARVRLLARIRYHLPVKYFPEVWK